MTLVALPVKCDKKQVERGWSVLDNKKRDRRRSCAGLVIWSVFFTSPENVRERKVAGMAGVLVTSRQKKT